VVTDTGTSPTAPGGVTTEIDVAEFTVNDTAGEEPNTTAVAPVKPVPVIVTPVPPPADPLAGVTADTTGAGTVGVTDTRALCAPQPTAFRARTATQYVVPFTSPDTVHDVEGATAAHDLTYVPATCAVNTLASYDVIALPPSSDGAPQDTTAEPPPGTAETDPGTPGTRSAYVNDPGSTAVPADVATDTSTTPAAPGGLTADTAVSDTTENDTAGTAPNSTPVAPDRSVPVIVTDVPPPAEPPDGDTDDTTGAAATGVTGTRADNGPHPITFRARTAT
jgi:hypothetical protein